MAENSDFGVSISARILLRKKMAFIGGNIRGR